MGPGPIGLNSSLRKSCCDMGCDPRANQRLVKAAAEYTPACPFLSYGRFIPAGTACQHFSIGIPRKLIQRCGPLGFYQLDTLILLGILPYPRVRCFSIAALALVGKHFFLIRPFDPIISLRPHSQIDKGATHSTHCGRLSNDDCICQPKLKIS